MRYLIDTNIIIYYLNGEDRAIEFIDNNLYRCSISIITFLEVLSFAYSAKEEKKIRDFLELFRIFDVDKKVTNIAIGTYKIKKIKVADNLIASTAKYYDLTLVTRNVKDFRNIDLNVINLYDEK
ncbi:MAG: type II toxin-antitoxin system VapC family toxin [Campylobacterota bacterium]|nr:type II toxin-antitoxin system VapC family toxin [Campylobacterota bacterium]